jgi:hypothetical protein
MASRSYTSSLPHFLTELGTLGTREPRQATELIKRDLFSVAATLIAQPIRSAVTATIPELVPIPILIGSDVA